MNIKQSILIVLSVIISALSFISCDSHIDEIDKSVRPGHIVCDDGSVLSFNEYVQSGKQAVAIVFDTNNSNGKGELGYAVYLWELPELAFSDSLGVEQGTSADIEALDGNDNTYAMKSSEETCSPLAESVFSIWWYGQSAYIPSVAEMRLLYSSRTLINSFIEKCGGDQLPTSSDDCWLWTSTEVEGQQKSKAWLYSIESGAMQETPKDQKHKARAIITLRK